MSVLPPFVCLIALFLWLVRLLRFQRLRALERRWAKYARSVSDAERLSYGEAWQVIKMAQELDMPFIMTRSLEFALFKTYGIPTISSLLAKTGQLTCLHTVGRRGEDTVVLLDEFFHNGVDSPRGLLALARMNCLHNRYRNHADASRNRISNADLLYTLSLFVLEPIRWTELYGWRSLSPLERGARYVWWREVGARMGIDFNEPLVAPRPGDGTTDGRSGQSLKDLEEWAEAYERKNMIFDPANALAANATRNLFLRPAPGFFKPYASKAVSVLLGQRLRLAMGFEKPPGLYYQLVPMLLTATASFVRHFSLPRLRSKTYGTAPKKGDEGVYQRRAYIYEPWYVSESLWSMNTIWSLLPLYRRPSNRYRSDGFRIEELGPEKLRRVGVEETKKSAESMSERIAKEGALGGCPFFIHA